MIGYDIVNKLEAFLLSSCLACQAVAAEGPGKAAAAEPPSALAQQFMANHEQRMGWWREARFGMFIHWGVYAIPAGTWEGKQTPGYAEWIMYRFNIPAAQYQALPAQFNPTQFNADEWVKLAKDAGMKYIVITAKHHDGFAMYRSQADKFNVVDATPWKRDPLAELAQAARKAGLRFGVYYSQSLDWNHAGGSTYEKQPWDAAVQAGDMDAYLDKVAVPQVKELLSNYGPLDIMWWDIPANMTAARGDKLLQALKLQPNIIMNNRLLASHKVGDFQTPEQQIPPNGMPGKDWETCMTMNGSWGYRAFDEKWKSSAELLRNLIDIASKGGNFLLNVGPTAQGVIPAQSVARLKEIGAWMAVNGQAVYGTGASPYAQQMDWGRITQKSDGGTTTLYLHVFDWPRNGKLVLPALRNEIRGATLLAGAVPLKASAGPQGIEISLPGAAPDPVSSTIVLAVKGRIAAQPEGG